MASKYPKRQIPEGRPKVKLLQKSLIFALSDYKTHQHEITHFNLSDSATF